MSKNILHISHKGYAINCPGNTMQAFRNAIQLGVDGIECDIHETIDHHYVVFHDDILVGRNIKEMQITEVRSVLLQEFFQIPTIEEVANVCRNRVKLLLDIKELSSFERFSSLIKSIFPSDDLLVASFDSRLIEKLTQFNHNIEFGLIVDHHLTTPVKELETARASLLVVKSSVITQDLLDEVTSNGYKVFAWNVSNASEINDIISMGVSGIISDDPFMAAQAIDNFIRNA